MAKRFADATADYHEWLSGYVALDREGLRKKREKMDDEKVFPFLRGTFYRWRWQSKAALAALPGKAAATAPRVLSAGDVHLENFGTWRDAEGRLAWGLNDFDEAAVLPFISDLVRLATSVVIAKADEPALLVGEGDAAAAILDGYLGGLADGRPFILDEEDHQPIRVAALATYNPKKEWEGIRPRDGAETPADQEVLHLLLTSLPQGSRAVGFWRTRKGLGALGRPRWTVVAEWLGGLVAREAKATAPSAAALPAAPASRIADHRRIVAEARRAADPAFCVTERWVIRRLSPEARKIELKDFLPKERPGAGHGEGRRAGRADDPAAGQLALLRAMGGEVANAHAGTAGEVAPLRSHVEALDGHDPSWLLRAAQRAAERVREDHAAFRADSGVVG